MEIIKIIGWIIPLLCCFYGGWLVYTVTKLVSLDINKPIKEILENAKIHYLDSNGKPKARTIEPEDAVRFVLYSRRYTIGMLLLAANVLLIIALVILKTLII